jgi:hypothetical protein
MDGIARAAIAPARVGLPVGRVPLTIRKAAGLAAEGYRLTIGQGGVTIAAADAAGRPTPCGRWRSRWRRRARACVR